MLLPHAGQSRYTLVKSLKTHLKKTLPKSNVKADIVYIGSELSCKINVKDKTPFEEQHELFVLSTSALKIMLGRLPNV